jgi:cytoskeleton protein RodZ
VWGNNPKSSSSQQPGDVLGPASEQMTVGRHLKFQREEQGQGVAEVAGMLCIHRAYLQAIEDNEIDKLPGPTYAVGFVRAYAEYLGLDGAKVVERFKDEGKVQEKRAQLIFPSPLPEGQIPSGPILLAAAACLAVVYGGWVFVSSPNDGIADMIPSLPDRIASLVGDNEVKALEAKKLEVETRAEEKAVASATAPTENLGPASTPGLEAQSAETNGASAPEVAASKETVAATSDDSLPSRSDTGAEVVKLTESIATAVASMGQATLDQTAVRPETLTLEALGEAIETTENAQKLESAATTETTVVKTEKIADEIKVDGLNSVVAKSAEEVQTAATAPTQIASTAIGESEVSSPPSASLQSLGDEPSVFGEAGEESRIKITALVDSWVEVRAEDGELLLTRVLRRGDSYHVPGQTGLTLVTGNAGGLEFSVDGKVVPKIGLLGTVRRNVKLDPKSLMDGTANDP